MSRVWTRVCSQPRLLVRCVVACARRCAAAEVRVPAAVHAAAATRRRALQPHSGDPVPAARSLARAHCARHCCVWCAGRALHWQAAVLPARRCVARHPSRHLAISKSTHCPHSCVAQPPPPHLRARTPNQICVSVALPSRLRRRSRPCAAGTARAAAGVQARSRSGRVAGSSARAGRGACSRRRRSSGRRRCLLLGLLLGEVFGLLVTVLHVDVRTVAEGRLAWVLAACVSARDHDSRGLSESDSLTAQQIPHSALVRSEP